MQCPLPEKLQQMLDETLPLDDQGPLHAHLESCPACQRKLEQLAAGGVTWDKTAKNLGHESPDHEAALASALEKLQDTPTSALQTQAEPIRGPVDDDLSFLQPSQKPNSLGRLDEFEILSVIGKGGFGIVLKAFDESLHRIVAIKVMAPQLAANGAARARFHREARAAAPITHENVVTIHKVSQDGAKFPYLAMQFISGVTLNEKIGAAGPLSVKEILRIGMQIAEGLAAAHKQGLVHRDIKPGNILLENSVERVKITDFGLARATDDASVTQSGTVAGTPMYMSPEQANGEAVDHRSDLFSLGSVLYVMCTGRTPFRATTTMAVMKRVCDDTPMPVQQVNTDIPEWLSAIVAKLHSKKPSERFQSAKEVADLLGRHLAHVQQPNVGATTIALPIPGDSDRVTSKAPPQRHRRIAGVLAAIVGIGLLIGFVCWVMEPSNALLDVEVSDPTVVLTLLDVHGKTIREKFISTQLRLPAGKYVLLGHRGDVEVHREDVELAKGDIRRIALASFPKGKEVATKAEEVLTRLVGTWAVKVEAGDPRIMKSVGKVNFDWVANGKFLRAYAIYDDGQESLTLYSFDARSKTFHRWFFASDAGLTSIQGPQEGKWDANTSVLTTQGDLPLFHKIEHNDCWIDNDNVDIFTWVSDQKATRLFQQIKKLTRLPANEAIGPKLPQDPKRSAEFALLDRLLGAWTKNAEVTLADVGGQKVESQSTSKNIAILGGRFVESDEHTPRGDRHDYTIVGYDVNRKTYRFWHFDPNGEVTEADGSWNQKENRLTWKSLDGRLNGSWKFPRPGELHVVLAGKDGQGRRKYEVEAIAKRADGAPDDGWVKLFNGKDLTGWKVNAGDWKVNDNILIGAGGAKNLSQHLRSERSDFENFHLRMQGHLKLGGSASVSLHVRQNTGTEAINIQLQHKNPGKLLITPVSVPNPAYVFATAVRTLKPDNWFDLEVKVDGPRFEIWLDGQSVIAHTFSAADAALLNKNGGIRLEVADPQSKLSVRKIEIKELPPDPNPITPDLQALQGTWTPTGGELNGAAATPATLKDFSEVTFKGADFHFHVEGAPLTARVTLGPGTNPKSIDLLREGDKQSLLGIYRLENDQLELCLGSLGMARPTAFKTKPASRLIVIRLKRKDVKPVGVLDFAEIHDADEKSFDAWLAQLKKDEFRPVSVSVHTHEDAPRYTAVAVKGPGIAKWEFTRVRAQDEKHVDDMRAKNYFALAQCAYRDNKQLRFAFLWFLNDQVSNDGIYSGEKDAIEAKIEDAKKRKARPIHRTAFEGAATVYGVVLGGSANIPWAQCIDEPLDACKAWVEKQKALGNRPDQLYAYGTGETSRFGCIAIHDPAGPEWDVSWALTKADYEKQLKERRTQGFRPQSALQHDTMADGVRFSVIWIRYRAGSTPDKKS